MKKLIALLLAVVMVLGLAACATKAETPATDTPATDTPAASTETETKTETKEETPAEETDAEFNPAVHPRNFDACCQPSRSPLRPARLRRGLQGTRLQLSDRWH